MEEGIGRPTVLAGTVEEDVGGPTVVAGTMEEGDVGVPTGMMV